MADPITDIPLQVPTSTVKSALALQAQINGNPRLIEYVLPGHPLAIRREWVFTTLNTNTTLIVAPGTGNRTVITHLIVLVKSDVTIHVDIRIGFGNPLPAESANGVDGILINHRMAPGGGVVQGDTSGPLCPSGVNLPLVITNTVPTSGKLVVIATFYQPAIA